MYSNDFFDLLISFEKRVTENVKAVPNRGGYTKKEFRMESVNGLYKFKGFLNQNEKFEEDFSLGLIYVPKEDRRKILLLRVNGPHGGTIDNPFHAQPHVHRTDAEDVNNGVLVERHRTFVNDYLTYEQGVQYYVQRINIISDDRNKHFPKPIVPIPTLFPDYNG